MIAYIALGGAMTAAAGSPKPRGQLYDIGGGRRLHMLCEGPATGAGPTVLLEAGAFGFSADWGAVQPLLAAEGVRSCAYDRAGLGFSDPGPAPRDGLAVAEDLEKLLAASGEQGPFILVGHSMAGLRLRLFAARNPDKVAGLVLVDAATPEAMDHAAMRGFVSQFANLTRLAAVGAQAGLFKPLMGTSFGDKIGLSGPASAEKRWSFANGRHNRWAAEEVAEWPLTAQQAREAGPLDPRWPVAVITAGAPGKRSGWKEIQAAPAEASRHGYVRHVEGAAHATLLGP
ncbi:MAG TPA: alpha/beta fold hydrolase, partial [Caulobacteraceae bacterium]|nr:alpha/beta fold hydrolase [Caulobacteraceae bacterium]